MGRKRKNHSQEFNVRVALEAVKGVYTLSELASCHNVNSAQIAQCKKQLFENAPLCFERGSAGGVVDGEALAAPLYKEIGRLTMEVDFLQRNAERTRSQPSRPGASTCTRLSLLPMPVAIGVVANDT